LKRMIDEPDLLDRLKSGIVRPMSIEDDATALRGKYEELQANRERNHVRASASRTTTHSPRPVDFAGVVLNYRTPDQAALAAASLRASRTPPSEILIVDNHS